MPDYSTAMALLKANLGFFDSAVDAAVQDYLQHLIQKAIDDLFIICKISLDLTTVSDADLVAMYAAWLYRCRVNGDDKPPMLRQAIRERQINMSETESHE